MSKKRKTRKQKIERAERVTRQQIEYAKLLQQKTELHQQKTELHQKKEELKKNQKAIRRKFLLKESLFIMILSGAVTFAKESDYFDSKTRYPKKRITIENEIQNTEDLGYVPKNEKLKNPVFYYKSAWITEPNDEYAYQFNITVRNKRKLLEYLKSIVENEKVELPASKVANYYYKKVRKDEIDLTEPSEFYVSYEYIDENTPLKIPLTQEEKEEFEDFINLIGIFVGFINSINIYRNNKKPYQKRQSYLKKRIKRLEENVR